MDCRQNSQSEFMRQGGARHASGAKGDRTLKETRVYKQAGDCSICADIYYHGAGSPVIIYIHGGALIFGARTWLSLEQIEFFVRAGFSVVSIDYRLAPETAFELIVEDIRDAIEWVRTKATEWYGFDTTNLAVMGGSAGGYLSLLSGTMDIKPKAIVSFYGYGDILGSWLSEPSEHYCRQPVVSKSQAFETVGTESLTDGAWGRFPFYLYCRQQGVWIQEVTKMDRTQNTDQLKQYNPIDHIAGDYPPTLLLHGDQDTDVPYEQSVSMYNRLIEKGIEAKLITVEGADHVFDQKFQQADVQSAFHAVIYFLNTHLKGRASE